MKKWMVVIIFVIIVAALTIYAYLLLFPPKPVVFEGIVPDNAIYYISTSNLNKKIQDLKNSSFFLKFSETSLYKSRIGPAREDFNSKAPFLKDFMDKDVAMAVLSLGKARDLKNSKKFSMENIGNFLLLIRVDRNKFPQLKRSIGEAYIAKYKGEVVSKRYRGVKISSFKATNWEQAINYAILSDTVVISNSLDDIQKSIDLFRNKSMLSLANNVGFRKAIARVKKDSLLWGYKNSKNYYADYLRQLQETKDTKSKIIMLQMKPLMSLMEVFKDASFYVDYDKQEMVFVLKGYTMFDTSKDDSGFISIIARDKAVDQKVFSLIPKDAIAYYACNQDALKCWNFWMNFLSSLSSTLNQQMSSNSSFKRPKVAFSSETIIKQAESFLGIDLKKDLIALLGDDFGIVFASLNELEVPVRMPSSVSTVPPQNISQHILFPQLYLFCGAKDRAKLEKIMEGIFQKITDNINTKAKEGMQLYRKTHPATAGSPEGQGTPKTYAQMQTAKEEDKLPVTLSEENYKDVNIHYLELSNFPLPFVQPNYCIVDKYFIFSISRDLTKKIIETYKSNSGSFNSNTEFASIKNNIPVEYSAIFFVNFRGVVKSVVQSSSFKKLHTSLASNPKPGFSSADLDSFLAALGTLNKFTLTTHKASGEDVLESQALLTIEE